MQLTSTEMTVPAGTISEPDIIIDIAALLASEVRQDEVAFVTPTKAPELLAAFNRSWRDIHQLVVRLESHKNKAEKVADNRKGVLLLEIIPAKLKGLGIASAADTRQAVIATDDEYGVLVDRVDQLEAAVAYLKGKLKSFENAYTSTKKIIGEDMFNMASRGSGVSGDTRVAINPSFAKLQRSGPEPKPQVTKTDGVDAPLARPGFGVSRYDK